MDIDMIKTILLVAQTQNFNDAAYLVPCSQSSVSRRVDAAEAELQTKLFTRPWDSPDRRTHLTPAGEKAIPILQRIMEDYRLLQAISDEEKATPCTITVGTRSNFKAEVFDRYPDINLDIQFGNMDGLLHDLKGRKLDAVFFCCMELKAEELREMEQLRLRLLGRVPMSVGVSENSPLAARRTVRMIDLKDELFLLQVDPSKKIPGIEVAQMQEFTERAKRVYGFSPKLHKINESMLDIRYQLAKDGKGIFPSFTPEAWRSMPGVTYVPLAKEDEHFMYYYLLSRPNEHERALRLFADYLADSITGRRPTSA